MGEKDFQKFMKTMVRILGITGETSVCFNRVSSGAIMVGPVITAAKDVSCEHKDLTKLAFGEGISVKVGLDCGNIEEILRKAYEDNEFRFDWPEHVLIQLKTDAVGISSPKFQEFISELRNSMQTRNIQTFFVTREGERYITLHESHPGNNRTLVSPGTDGIKGIEGSRVTMEIGRQILNHSTFQEDLHHFWATGVVNALFLDEKSTSVVSDVEPKVTEVAGVVVETQLSSSGEFKIGQEQVHRLVTFFAPGVTLEEVQKVMEAMQLSEKRK